MKPNITSLIKHFQIPGECIHAQAYGSGHINDTFALTLEENQNSPQYLLQRINHQVFRKPFEVMENIVRVTEHIRGKLEEQGFKDLTRRVMAVIPTQTGEYCYQDSEGNYWRVYNFIENARTYDTLDSPDQAYEAAKAFGQFQKQLVDLPEPPLHDAIPDFHNGPKRFQAFQQALEKDSHNRAASVKPEIDFLLQHGFIFNIFPEKVSQGEIPIIVTHNDTKINNVMMDKQTGEGICVIDLDTVMPGISLYDFGDLARTSLTSADEDEQDLSKVVLEMPRFEALVRGYLSTAGEFLNKTERTLLVTGAKMMTLIMGTRFLTDFLQGDTYYKIHREGHNVDRCRTQIELIQQITKYEREMDIFIEKVL